MSIKVKKETANIEDGTSTVSRRQVMAGSAVVAAGAAVAAGQALADTPAAGSPYADPSESALPPVDMAVTQSSTALVVVDPQIDFLSEKGVTWSVVGESVTELNTVENIERLFIAAKAIKMPVVISPHYYYPQDHKWQFGGALEKVMHMLGMFDRPGPLDLSEFEG